MISELTLAMTHKAPLEVLAETIHCYPTQAEVFQRIALQYASTRKAAAAALRAGWPSIRFERVCRAETTARSPRYRDGRYRMRPAAGCPSGRAPRRPPCPIVKACMRSIG